MFRYFFALFAFVPVFAFAVTWTGSHNNGKYPNASSCLAEQKGSWDRSWRESVSCRTWSDTGWAKDGDTQYVSSMLGGCASGGVSCSAPYVPGEESCSTKIGTSEIVNFTVGYTRSPNISTDPNWKLVGAPNKVPASGLLCNPASPCQLKHSGFSDSDMAWQSAAPTPNGLYRLSLDISATYTGESCAPTELDNAALSKTAPIPPCPGFTGEVNGVPGCYGNASNPTSNDVPESKPKPPQAGNPPAGAKPSSGEGSGTGGAGRTPSTGDGGPAGGPAAAAGSGTKPDGTVPKPDDGKEQAACGAPGQPKCSINEAGTPDGKSAFDSANTGLDQNKDGWLAEISKVKDLTAPGWTWTFQLPSGCTPLDVPAFNLTLDVCRFQPIIHDIMSMLWAIATVMGCALMVFNATGKN